MQNIQEILNRKRSSFNKVSPETSVSDALYQMCAENADHLIVVKGDEFVGVLSEHDITQKLMSIKTPLTRIFVRELMNTKLPVANADDSLDRCMWLMRQFHVRYLPVFNGLEFIGILTSDDIIEEAVITRTSNNPGNFPQPQFQ